MRVKRLATRLGTLALTLAIAASSAAADTPQDALAAAVRATAGAKTARVNIVQHNVTAGRTTDMTASGVLVGGDHDLVVSGEAGPVHRVSVGPQVKERRPDSAAQPWRAGSRPAPSQTSALGPLTLADGTSVGDPKLYRTITDAGSETLPTGSARKIVGELNMAALAAAMKVSAADAARMARWSGTLTFWIGADGRVARNAVHLVVPGPAGPTTIDAQIDLSDLDAPLSVTLP